MFDIRLPSLLSDERLCNLAMYSKRASDMFPEGIIAEFGVYQGGSLELIAKLNPGRAVYGIDSFQGLPPATENDFHVEGEFSEVNHLAITGYFKMLYPHVRILKGFSPSVFEFFDEHCKFSFVHVDIDMYRSCADAMEFFFPRLYQGGMMLFDDYGFTSTPGVKKFLDEWLPEKELSLATELTYADGKAFKQFLIIK
jgi:O-methyltransferase